MKTLTKIKPYMSLLLLLSNNLSLQCMHNDINDISAFLSDSTGNSQTEQEQLQIELNDSLIQATLENNIIDMQAAINQGADVEALTVVNSTSLSFAAQNDLSNPMQLLLDAGANVNTQKSIFQNTPLIWAAKNNNLPMIGTLVAYGADLNLLNKNNNTALQVATTPEIQEYLTAAEDEYQLNVSNTCCITGLNTSENKNSFLLRAYFGAAPIQATINNNTYLIDLYTIYKTYRKNNKIDELKKLIKRCNFDKCSTEQKANIIKLGLPLTKDQLSLYNNLINRTKLDDKFSDTVIFTKK